MGRGRNFICEFYVCKGECTKGRDADHNGICQTCAKYSKKAGVAPAKKDLRKQKLAKIDRKERKEWY